MSTAVYPAPAISHPAGSQLLALRDIHLPSPISWWPPAPGWWLLLSVLISILVIFFIIRKIRSGRRLKRATNDAFDSIRQQYAHSHNKIRLVKELSILLRRASISFYPRKDTAGLTGKDWLHFLDTTLPEKVAHRFNSKQGEILLHAPYMPDTQHNHEANNPLTETDVSELLQLCKQWLNAQPVKNPPPLDRSEKTTTSVERS